MSDFKAKMHQNPISPWGAYSAPPDPLGGFKGPTSKGRGGEGGDGRGREGRRGDGRKGKGGDGRRGDGREGDGRGVLWSPKNP